MVRKVKTTKVTSEMPTKQAELLPMINTKKYVITSNTLKGQINQFKVDGKKGDIVEMEPWMAKYFKLGIKEIEE